MEGNASTAVRDDFCCGFQREMSTGLQQCEEGEDERVERNYSPKTSPPSPTIMMKEGTLHACDRVLDSQLSFITRLLGCKR